MYERQRERESEQRKKERRVELSTLFESTLATFLPAVDAAKKAASLHSLYTQVVALEFCEQSSDNSRRCFTAVGAPSDPWVYMLCGE